MTTYNRQSVKFTDGTIFTLGNGYFPKTGMKKNHEIKTTGSNIEYVVNNANGFAYLSI